MCRRDLVSLEVHLSVHPFLTQKKDIYMTIFQLGIMLLLIDSFIRWSYLHQASVAGHRPWTSETFSSFARVLLGTSAETIAFHMGTTLSCYILLKLEKAVCKTLSISLPKSDVRQEFSLFYSSITKLFLLLLLTIWLPTSKTSHFAQNPLPGWVDKLWRNDTHLLTNTLSILDDDKLDREWIVRNVLGGMSAGFGLRVILDSQPIFTTVIILSGWMAKTAVTTLISQWVGGDKSSGEAWLAYSIP
ncbi:hypothetical protein BJ165DRAFT_1499646 [Panaeolus papilionaceus]|nr:hypothetical protein BJ165DRAFT_1499646 [Panaeolus papilionaceus]